MTYDRREADRRERERDQEELNGISSTPMQGWLFIGAMVIGCIIEIGLAWIIYRLATHTLAM